MLTIAAFALALEPTGNASKLEFQTTAAAVTTRSSETRDAGPSKWAALGGAGGLGLTLFYARPVVDDESPPALGPYLQRTPTLQFGAEFQHFTGEWRAAGQPTSRRAGDEWWAYANAEAYPGSGYISGSVWVDSAHSRDDVYPTSTDPTAVPTRATSRYVAIPALFQIGARIAEALYWCGWQGVVASTDGGPLRVDQLGVMAGLRAVWRKQLDLQLVAGLDRGGGHGSGYAEWFLTRSVGLWGSAELAHVHPGYGYALEQTSYSAAVGGGLWISSQIEIAVSYAPTVSELTASDLKSFAQTFNLALVVRPQRSRGNRAEQ